MSKNYTERKKCPDCGRVKLIATFATVCPPCKINGHDKLDQMISAFCLGKSLGV